jgi:hypothetical protein
MEPDFQSNGSARKIITNPERELTAQREVLLSQPAYRDPIRPCLSGHKESEELKPYKQVP